MHIGLVEAGMLALRAAVENGGIFVPMVTLTLEPLRMPVPNRER